MHYHPQQQTEHKLRQASTDLTYKKNKNISSHMRKYQEQKSLSAFFAPRTGWTPELMKGRFKSILGKSSKVTLESQAARYI